MQIKQKISGTIILIGKLVVFFCVVISLSLIIKEALKADNFIVQIATVVFFVWLFSSFMRSRDKDVMQKTVIEELLTEMDTRKEEWEEIRHNLDNDADDLSEDEELIKDVDPAAVLVRMDKIDAKREERMDSYEESGSYLREYELGQWKRNRKS